MRFRCCCLTARAPNLDGDDSVLSALRDQVSQVAVEQREFTGVGFFTQLKVSEIATSLRGSARISDVSAELPGLRQGAGFVIFVDDGKLSSIEGFAYDEPWPVLIESFMVHPRSSFPDLSRLLHSS